MHSISLNFSLLDCHDYAEIAYSDKPVEPFKAPWACLFIEKTSYYTLQSLCFLH